MWLSLKLSPHSSSTKSHILLIVFIGLIATSNPMDAVAQDSTPDVRLTSPIIHVVQPGESLFSIADQYGVAADAIVSANALDGAPKVVVGLRTVIPLGHLTMESENVVIQFGDSFDQIASRYEISREVLGLANRVVNPALVFVGQQLVLPSSEVLIGSTASSLYQITSGQTFWKAALLLDTSPSELIIANDFINPHLITDGQVIRIPADKRDGASLPEPWRKLELHPLPLEPGRTSSLLVETSQSGTIAGSFLGNDLRLIPDGENRYVALLGIYRWTAPGIYPLTVSYTGEDGSETAFSRLVQIVAGGYTSEIINLSPEDAAVLADSETVQGEAGYIQQTMSGYSSERLWDGLFRLPASGIMSSAFGTARSYDGGNGYDTFHAGADLAALTGTPIYAPAAGVIVDTASLSVRGYATILDHGWGVYSGFWHQSGILVEPGDIVAAGQQIGTVGNTGLSTASHVHWEMWVTGVQVDPLEWAREEFP